MGSVKPVRPQSLDSAVLDALASYVDHANILPDGRLPSERVLCEALGVGRSTVREALKRWEALGIVEMRKGSGAYLKVAFGPNLLHVPLILARPSKVKNLLQILQVRRALEGEAAAICAASASDADVAAIGAALVKMETAHAGGDGSEADWQFHQSDLRINSEPVLSHDHPVNARSRASVLGEPAAAAEFRRGIFPFHRSMYRSDSAAKPKDGPRRGAQDHRLRGTRNSRGLSR